MTRYTTSRPDNWIIPRQRRHADWGHGKIISALEDDTLWSNIRTGLIGMNAIVWGVAAVIFLFVGVK